MRHVFRTSCLSGVFSLVVASVAWGQAAAGTTVQLPTFGVAVDAKGVLSVKTFVDPNGQLRAQRLAEAKAKLPGNVLAKSPLRKVSLPRLERALRKRLDAGQPADDVLQHLAGLQRVQFVFCYPDEKELVIAGPAEGWAADPSGRVVGVSTGRPVVRLDDLAVALRAYRPGAPHAPFIGCTISPTAEGLNRMLAFQKTIPRSIPQSQQALVGEQIAQGMRDSLGLAEIQVFGISNQTHFAHVLLEADYRMKLMAVGLERPPVKMATFIGALDSPQHAALQRWWFTPDYDCVKTTDDRLALELVGQGVQLNSENKQIRSDGTLVDSGQKPSKPSELFTTAFTRKYPEIAERSPVYAEMRNLIDLLVAMAFVNRHDLAGKAGWKPSVLLDEDTFSIETLPVPKNVPCVALSVWKGNRLLTPAGGGVSITAHQALQPEHAVKDGKPVPRPPAIAAGESWWWD